MQYNYNQHTAYNRVYTYKFKLLIYLQPAVSFFSVFTTASSFHRSEFREALVFLPEFSACDSQSVRSESVKATGDAVIWIFTRSYMKSTVVLERSKMSCEKTKGSLPRSGLPPSFTLTSWLLKGSQQLIFNKLSFFTCIGRREHSPFLILHVGFLSCRSFDVSTSAYPHAWTPLSYHIRIQACRGYRWCLHSGTISNFTSKLSGSALRSWSSSHND